MNWKGFEKRSWCPAYLLLCTHTTSNIKEASFYINYGTELMNSGYQSTLSVNNIAHCPLQENV
jgi:hypothetical protein